MSDDLVQRLAPVRNHSLQNGRLTSSPRGRKQPLSAIGEMNAVDVENNEVSNSAPVTAFRLQHALTAEVGPQRLSVMSDETNDLIFALEHRASQCGAADYGRSRAAVSIPNDHTLSRLPGSTTHTKTASAQPSNTTRVTQGVRSFSRAER